MIHYRFLILLFTLSAISQAYADDRMHLAIQAGPEYFKWQEFETTGPRLLEETGVRFGIGAAWDNFRRGTSGVLYGVNGRFYFGTVDYDGQACNFFSGTCEPSMTDTSYFGVNIQAEGGYRFGSGFGFDLWAAIGLDDWLRSIADTATASGGEEEYFILYAKLGPGMFHDVGSWRYRFQIGVKYPFYTQEYVDDPGVPTLSPKGRASGFARLQADLGNRRRFGLGVAVYYDSYRFAESDHERATILGFPATVWQPESHMDTIGVQVRVSIF